MYNAIPIKYSVFPDNSNPIFGEGTTHISVDDEAAGGYIVIEQFPDEGEQKIRLNLEEVEELHRLANKLMTLYSEFDRHTTVNKQYEIEEKYNEYGEPSYRFIGLINGCKGLWRDTEEMAIADGENYTYLHKGK